MRRSNLQRHVILALFLFANGLLFAHSADAENRCEETDSLEKCWERWNPSQAQPLRVGPSATDLGDATNTALARMPQPLDNSGSNLALDSKNFFDLFSAVIENANFDSKNQDMTLTWNTDLFGLKPGRSFQVQTTIHETQLYEPLKMALPEAQRTSLAASLEEQLEDFDDITYSLAYAPLNKRLGRQFTDQAPLYQGLFSSLVSAASTAESFSANDDVLELLQTLTSEYTQLSPDASVLTFSDIETAITGNPSALNSTRAQHLGSTPDPGTAILAQFEGFARREAELTSLVRKAANSGPISFFSKLLNNQPQLSVSLLHRNREERIGPNSTSIKVSYEVGLKNLNGLHDSMGASCMTAGAALPRTCLQGFNNYLSGAMDQLAQQHQFTFSAEYKQIDAYDFSLPLDGNIITVQSDRAEEYRISASYGRAVALDKEGNSISRLDLKAAFEDVDGDPMRQDRGTASLIYTQNLSDSLQLVLGAAWATKPEYLMDVDEEVTANFGLRFRLEGVKKEDKP